MGTVEVPAGAWWGAQTQRAANHFNISGRKIPTELVRALGAIKGAAATANCRLGLLPDNLGEAIAEVARELADGELIDQFPVDVYQTGSGTSWNMNANEVIANRANVSLGSALGSRSPIHPNDHVNMGQSSNCVIPTAIQIANRRLLDPLNERLSSLVSALDDRQIAFRDVIKLGRTHLQDAVPMVLGQAFGAWMVQLEQVRRQVSACAENLEELPLGGTAVGTGFGSHARFPEESVARIAELTGLPFRPAMNRFALISSRDAQVQLMGVLNQLSVVLMKVSNDLRLLASGPRGGFSEIHLPSLQPGSSMMPGKVNPVIPEMVIQVAASVMGKNQSVTIAAQNGPLELNIMMPLIASETVEALEILTAAIKALDQDCVRGIEANAQQARAWLDRSLAMVTALVPDLGYDKAAEIAYLAWQQGKTVREVVLEQGLMDEAACDRVLNPNLMLGPSLEDDHRD